MRLLYKIVLLLIISNPLYSQFDAVLADQIIINEDCEGHKLTGKFKVYGPIGDSIKFYNLTSDICEMKFWQNGNEITSTDTIIMYDQKNYEIEFSFKFYKDEDLVIQYSTEYNQNKSIPIYTGSYYLTHKEVESGKKKIINLKENCSDSIRIYFPYGGTVTGVTVHENKKDKEFVKSIGYGMGDETNYITFGINEVGKYYIRYAACWWGEDFWLELINE